MRLYHPLPTGVQRDFVSTPLGKLEVLVSKPRNPSDKQPPVLIVHGGFDHASVWLEWMTNLSEHHLVRTYAVSVSNYGASYMCSSWVRMVYQTSLDDMAFDVMVAVHQVEEREGTAPVLFVTVQAALFANTSYAVAWRKFLPSFWSGQCHTMDSCPLYGPG